MNYLHTAKGDFDGLARNFIARYLLDANSLEDAWERIRSTPHCVGHNYQIMNLTTGYTVDIEVAPFDRIGYFVALPGHPHFHSNMYSLILVDDTPSQSSIHREARYKQLSPPTSFDEALAVLSDTQYWEECIRNRADQEEPIYRNTTLNTVVFDYYGKHCVVYMGVPSQKEVVYSYHFSDEL